MRYRARQHLRHGHEFARVRAEGRRVHCGAFILQITTPPVAEGQRPLRRFGVIASRRVGNAVKRNRAKRQFREIFRLNQERLPEHCDVVVVVLSSFDRCGFEELQERYRSAIEHRKPDLTPFQSKASDAH